MMILSWFLSFPIFCSASSVRDDRVNSPCGSVVPWPTCAARILAEKSPHSFFESYPCGDTSDTYTCPVRGCIAVVTGWDGLGSGSDPYSPLSPCNSVVSHSFLSFSPEKGGPWASLFLLDFVAVKRNHVLASSNRSSWKRRSYEGVKLPSWKILPSVIFHF